MQPTSPRVERSTASRQDSFIQVRQLASVALLSVSIVGLLAAPVPSNKPSTYPAWWFSRGVIVQATPTNASPSWPTNYPKSDDYATINEGELKNFATQAYNELQSSAPTNVWGTPAGQALASTVTNWSPTTGDDYAVINLGQLKTVAKPFYNVLTQIGYSSGYPWTGSGADDYAVANIGQTKNAFSFDVGAGTSTNGVPNWWEQVYFGQADVAGTNSPSGNGLTLIQDYNQGNNPTNYYSQSGQTLTPSESVFIGNNQTSPASAFAALPLGVLVANGSGGPAFNNAPVTFTVTSGGGQIATTSGGTGSTNLQLPTNSSGQAQIYFRQPSGSNVTSTVTATTGGQTVTFTETSEGIAAPPTFSPPAGSYASTQTVTLASATPSATIYYTTDGVTTPTPSSPLSVASGGTISVSGNEVIQAIAVASGYANSPVTSGNYTVGSLSIVSLNPFPGAAGSVSPPMVVRVLDGAGNAVANAPVTYTVMTGGGQLVSDPLSADTQSSMTVETATNGDAVLYYIQPTGSHVTSTIAAEAEGQSVTFTAMNFFVPELAGSGSSFQFLALTDSGNLQIVGNGVSVPSPVGVDVSEVVSMAVGNQHSVAVENDGSVWAWGIDSNGQLGDGNDDSAGGSDPTGAVQVVAASDSPALPAFKAVAAGAAHTLALTLDGQVWAWGSNSEGQLGNPSATLNANSDSPNPILVQFPAGTQITAIAANENYSVALDSSGNVWVWGDNSYNELGDPNNTSSQSNVPVVVPGLTGSPITSISAGTLSIVALDNNHQVWTWGDNEYGELGQGNQNPVYTVVHVTIPSSSPITSICAGLFSSYSVDAGGNVWGWGDNGTGELGSNPAGESESPIQITGFTNTGGTVALTSVAAANSAAVGLGSDGTIWSWGGDYEGASPPLQAPVRIITTSGDTNDNGIPDSWEMQYFGSLQPNPYEALWNGDTLIQAYQQGVIPVAPVITATGQNQSAPQATFLTSPITANISTISGGMPLANVPVTFSNSGSYLVYFSTTPGGPISPTLTVNTDSNGNAQAYYAGPDTAGVTNTVQVSYASGSTSVNESTIQNPGDILPPTGITTTGAGTSQANITWTNNATNASYILVQQSTDGLTWVTIANIPPSSTSYTVTGLNPNGTYLFGVIAGSN